MKYSCILILHVAFFFELSSAGLFSKRNLLLKSLKYKPCSDDPGIVGTQDLSVSTTSEGDLIIGGAFFSARNLVPPLKAKISMSRSIMGLKIPMPCFKNFGSCTFENVCDYGYSSELCPGKLDEHDLPCRCPIEMGRYVLPGAQFSMDPTRWAGLLAGSYSGTAKLFSDSGLLACYNYAFELQ